MTALSDFLFISCPGTDPLVSQQTTPVIQTPGDCLYEAGNRPTKAVSASRLQSDQMKIHLCFNLSDAPPSVRFWCAGRERDESRGGVGGNAEIVIYFNLPDFWLQVTAK